MMRDVAIGRMVPSCTMAGRASTAEANVDRGHLASALPGNGGLSAAAMLGAGVGLRGSGHRALGYEQALRLVGMWLDDQPASRVTIIDQAGSFLLRSLPPMPADPPFVMTEFTPDLLAAMGGRRRRERRAPPRGWFL